MAQEERFARSTAVEAEHFFLQGKGERRCIPARAVSGFAKVHAEGWFAKVQAEGWFAKAHVEARFAKARAAGWEAWEQEAGARPS